MKLLRSLQIKFEHISDTTLQSQSGIDEMPRVLAGLCGEREGDDPRAVREAIFDLKNRCDESLSMFVLRRERKFSQARSLGMPLPEQLKGVLLEEGVGLTQQGEQNLPGSWPEEAVDARHVSVALRSMDTTRRKLTDASTADVQPI